MAYAISGRIDQDPFKTPKGILSAPTAPELPQQGFVEDISGFIRASINQNEKVIVKKDSERLQILEPFAKWDNEDFIKHKLLVKTKGKCTTDHISPAGAWLRFRGHLDKISDNMLIGAINSFHKEPGKGFNSITKSYEGLSKIARDYKTQKMPWIIVGDENYGEGSSREHAAMSPRFLGASTVIVKSFARIHETNLKSRYSSSYLL